MGRARASRFYNGSITVYSRLAGQELLPKEVRRQVFVKDYSDPQFNSESYRQSKIKFVVTMAKHVQSRFKATYGIAESGATEASGLGKKLRPAGAFTAVAVVAAAGVIDIEIALDRVVAVIALVIAIVIALLF